MKSSELGQRFGPKFGAGGSAGEGYGGMESCSMGGGGRGWVSVYVLVVDADWNFGRREDVVGIGDIPCSLLGVHLYS